MLSLICGKSTVRVIFAADFPSTFVCKTINQLLPFFSVFQLISRRRFQQIDVLEGINVLISISGKNLRISFCFILNYQAFSEC